MLHTFYYLLFLTSFFCNAQYTLSEFGFDKAKSEHQKAIKELAQVLIDDYNLNEEKNEKVSFFGDQYKLNLLAGNYKEFNIALDSFQFYYERKYNFPGAVSAVPYELFSRIIQDSSLDSLGKDQIIEELYNNRSNFAKFYFDAQFNKDLLNLKSKIDTDYNDTLDFNQAIKLCKDYLTFSVYSETQNLVKSFMKRKELELFNPIDTLILDVDEKTSVSALMLLPYRNKTKNSPTILMNSIYPSSEYDLFYLKLAALNGYNIVVAFSRGKFQQNGNVISPFENEVNDVNAIIDWITKQPWSNGEVGMFGGSYLGFSQWAAMKKPHPALKTIVPLSSVGFGIDFPMHNSVFMNYMYRWIDRVTNSTMDSNSRFWQKQYWDSLYLEQYKLGKTTKSIQASNNPITNQTFLKWLAHPDFDEYWQDKIPYQKDFERINIPVLSNAGYFDGDQLGALYYFNELNKRNANAESYLVLGPYDHKGATGVPSPKHEKYSLDEVAKINFYDIVFEWFDYIFKGAPKPALLKNKINYQVMGTNQWYSSSTMQELKKETLPLYLSPKHSAHENYLSLETSKPKMEAYTNYVLDLADRSDSLFFKQTSPKTYDSTFIKRNRLIFATPKFDKDFVIQGDFGGKIYLETNKKDVDLGIELIEETKDGKYFTLSTYLGRASYAKNREKRQLLTPGKKEEIPITNSYFTARKIEKGSRLLVTVRVNKSMYWEINYGTGKPVAEESIADAGEPVQIKFYNDSYIEIPVSEVR